MKRISMILLAALFSCQAFAGFMVTNSSNKVLGFASVLNCGAGVTCTMGTTASGAKVALLSPGANGEPMLSGAQATWTPFPVTALTGVGTSTTGSATTLYLTQVFIPENGTLTGIAVNNAATVGTNKYIVALFNASGVPLASSAAAGVLTAGASAWQKVPFTSTYAAVGPAVYYVGVYINGTTDTFYTIPAAGEYVGVAGTVTGQTFGTVATVVLPTTFTAGAGPIVHTY